MSRFHIIQLNGTSTTLHLQRVLRDAAAPRSIALPSVIYPATMGAAEIDLALVRCRQVNKAWSGTLNGVNSDVLGVFAVEVGTSGKLSARLPAQPEYRTLPRGEVEKLKLSLVNISGTPVDASGVVITLKTQGC